MGTIKQINYELSKHNNNSNNSNKLKQAKLANNRIKAYTESSKQNNDRETDRKRNTKIEEVSDKQNKEVDIKK